MPSILRAPLRWFARLLLPQQTMHRTEFEALPPIDADVVFLGDSITEYGLWGEWFPHLRVVNRGIAGDTTAGVLARLDTAFGRQRVVSILIGTNDLGLGMAPAAIAGNVRQLIRAIRGRSPDSRVLLNSVMPRARSYREAVTALNTLLAQVAADEGAEFIDLWPALADGSGALRAEFTLDRLHLTGAGYAAWVEVLGPSLR